MCNNVNAFHEVEVASLTPNDGPSINGEPSISCDVDPFLTSNTLVEQKNYLEPEKTDNQLTMSGRRLPPVRPKRNIMIKDEYLHQAEEIAASVSTDTPLIYNSRSEKVFLLSIRLSVNFLVIR